MPGKVYVYWIRSELQSIGLPQDIAKDRSVQPSPATSETFQASVSEVYCASFMFG